MHKVFWGAVKGLEIEACLPLSLGRGAGMINLIAPMFLQVRYKPHFTNLQTERQTQKVIYGAL